MAHFVLVPDITDQPPQQHVGLFADVKDVLSVPQAAEVFGVCPQTVRRLIASGELASVHVGRSVRITKQALIDFIESQGVRA